MGHSQYHAEGSKTWCVCLAQDRHMTMLLRLLPSLPPLHTTHRQYHERKFWSGSFLLLSASIIVMLVLPWLRDQLGGENAIAFVLFFTFSSPIRVSLTSTSLTVYHSSCVWFNRSLKPWPFFCLSFHLVAWDKYQKFLDKILDENLEAA